MNKLYTDHGPNAITFCKASKWTEDRPGYFVRRWFGYTAVVYQRSDGLWVGKLWHRPSHPIHDSVHGPYRSMLLAKLAVAWQIKQLVWEWRHDHLSDIAVA